MTIREELALAEAVRALDEQRSTIDTLQTRAGLVMAVGAIANVGLGPLVFEGHVGIRWPWLTIPGIFAAAIGYACALTITWPVDFKHALPRRKLLDAEGSFDVADDVLVDTVVRSMENANAENAKVLSRLTNRLMVTILAVAVNGATWVTVGTLGRWK